MREPPETAVRGPESPGVLVVDDDPVLLTLLDTVLRQQGFAVWLAADGREALSVYQREQAHVAVVLLDVRMPVLDGPRTLAELRRLNPDVVCCFMSGHTGQYSDDELLSMGARHCFDKPFRMDEVAQFLWQTALETRDHHA